MLAIILGFSGYGAVEPTLFKQLNLDVGTGFTLFPLDGVFLFGLPFLFAIGAGDL